jgi:hypothetical protein
MIIIKLSLDAIALRGASRLPMKPILADDASLIRPTKIDDYHQVIAVYHPLRRALDSGC